MKRVRLLSGSANYKNYVKHYTQTPEARQPYGNHAYAYDSYGYDERYAQALSRRASHAAAPEARPRVNEAPRRAHIDIGRRAAEPRRAGKAPSAAPRRAAQARPADRPGRADSRSREAAKPREAKKPRAIRLRAPKIVYKRDHSIFSIKFLTPRLVFTLALIFLTMVGTTWSYATLRAYQRDNTALRDELVALQEEEASLKARIAEEYDVTNVEKIATMRLNMSKPKAHQIVYIKSEKQDYAVQWGYENEEPEPENVWEYLGGLLVGAKATLLNILSYTP